MLVCCCFHGSAGLVPPGGMVPVQDPHWQSNKRWLPASHRRLERPSVCRDPPCRRPLSTEPVLRLNYSRDRWTLPATRAMPYERLNPDCGAHPTPYRPSRNGPDSVTRRMLNPGPTFRTTTLDAGRSPAFEYLDAREDAGNLPIPDRLAAVSKDGYRAPRWPPGTPSMAHTRCPHHATGTTLAPKRSDWRPREAPASEASSAPVTTAPPCAATCPPPAPSLTTNCPARSDGRVQRAM